MFQLVKNKGRNGGETLLGISLGWLLYVSPIFFFGDMGAITGLILVFVVGFVVLDLLTPGKLWEEIRDKQNVAVAIFSGAVAVGLAIIVAAAIHG